MFFTGDSEKCLERSCGNITCTDWRGRRGLPAYTGGGGRGGQGKITEAATCFTTLSWNTIMTWRDQITAKIFISTSAG